MEDAKVLNPKHRAAGFYGLLALSALSAIGSFWLAVAPPILKSDRIEQEIVASLARGESYRGAAPCRLGQSAFIVSRRHRRNYRLRWSVAVIGTPENAEHTRT